MNVDTLYACGHLAANERLRDDVQPADARRTLPGPCPACKAAGAHAGQSLVVDAGGRECGVPEEHVEAARALPGYDVTPTAFEPDGSWRPSADTMRLDRRG